MDNTIKPSTNFDVMRARIEFLFRMVGKIYSDQSVVEMPPQVAQKLANMTARNGIDIAFLHRDSELIDFSEGEAKRLKIFGEIVTRHFNVIRKQMEALPAVPMTEMVANIEIVIREGIDILMIEAKAFFEREQMKADRIVKTLDEIKTEVHNG